MFSLIKRIFSPQKLNQSKLTKLNLLLDSIDDIYQDNAGTYIKFKGHLVNVADGTIINQSLGGNIVQLGNTVHLNPELKKFDSVKSIDLELKAIQQKSLDNMKKLSGESSNCKCTESAKKIKKD